MGVVHIPDVHLILDWIILLGAAAVAILNILKLFDKPSSFFKKIQEKKMTELLKKGLDDSLPEYFNKYNNERSKELDTKNEALTKKILDYCKKEFNRIIKINEDQSQTIDLLRRNVLDILRQDIESIYYKYRGSKKIPTYVWEHLEELYNDYCDGGGNHHIHKLYNRMKVWEKTDEIPDYEK